MSYGILGAMLVVLDTSVVVVALRSKNGASNALLARLASRKLEVLASPPLFLEYEDVLLRPEHVAVHRLSTQQVEQFLSELAALIRPVQIHFQWRPQLTDPADETVLETALNGSADAIVTHNVKHFAPAIGRFDLQVLSPAEMLRRLRDE